LDEVTELDLKRLQGKWEQVYLEADGMVNPPDDHTAPGVVTVIENDTFQVGTPSGSTLLAGTFTLDATTNPKSITWIDSIGRDAGKHLPSIYRLDDDNFTFVAADEGAPRPTEFETALGLTMRQFVRVRSLPPA
jgi:uncharacterized protein (TIGR03067 family)